MERFETSIHIILGIPNHQKFRQVNCLFNMEMSSGNSLDIRTRRVDSAQQSAAPVDVTARLPDKSTISKSKTKASRKRKSYLSAENAHESTDSPQHKLRHLNLQSKSLSCTSKASDEIADHNHSNASRNQILKTSFKSQRLDVECTSEDSIIASPPDCMYAMANEVLRNIEKEALESEILPVVLTWTSSKRGFKWSKEQVCNLNNSHFNVSTCFTHLPSALTD